MIRFCVLGSGSKGNAVYCEVDGYGFLLDCGFNQKALQHRLSLINRTTDDVKCVLTTHNHSDHTGCSDMFNRSVDEKRVTVQPFDLRHDIPCVGYTVSDSSGNSLAYITDTDCMPEESLKYLLDINAVIIEANHDVELLTDGPYVVDLQERVFNTHLRNEQTREILETIATDELGIVICFHISETNNRPELAKYEAECGLKAAGVNCIVDVASQGEPTKMYTII